MKKRVVFTGGSQDGLNRLSEYVRKDESNGNKSYYEFVDKIEDLPLCVEIDHVASKVRKLIKHDKVHTLIILDASETVRNTFISQACDERLGNLEVFRIWFNEYIEDVPDAYDYVIDPESRNFDDILDNYFLQEA